jgi:hypothetical protein
MTRFCARIIGTVRNRVQSNTPNAVIKPSSNWVALSQLARAKGVGSCVRNASAATRRRKYSVRGDKSKHGPAKLKVVLEPCPKSDLVWLNYVWTRRPISALIRHVQKTVRLVVSGKQGALA